jgi:hypothetical protein
MGSIYINFIFLGNFCLLQDDVFNNIYMPFDAGLEPPLWDSVYQFKPIYSYKYIGFFYNDNPTFFAPLTDFSLSSNAVSLIQNLNVEQTYCKKFFYIDNQARDILNLLSYSEVIRYYVFLWGFALIDLNSNLLLTYSYFVNFLFFKYFNFCLWPLSFAFSSLIKGLSIFLSIYRSAYNTFSFLCLVFLFFIVLFMTLCHLLAIFYLIIYLNILVLAYKSTKYVLFSLLQILLNIYLYTLIFLSNIWQAKSFLFKILNENLLGLLKVKSFYFYHWSLEMWLDGITEPFGGHISYKDMLWSLPSWMYWGRMASNHITFLRKTAILNLWSRLMLFHKKKLGVREKKWWNFLMAWRFRYALRNYYYSIFGFLVSKAFRLIYFFFVFSFKFIFFKFLKFIMGFSFLYNVMQIFLFYYINIYMYSRKFLSYGFYYIILPSYMYLKSYVISFVSMNLHFLIYKLYLFFSPRNYGFFNARSIKKLPLVASFENLRRLSWFQRVPKDYEQNYLTTFLKYQMVFFFYLYLGLKYAYLKFFKSAFWNLVDFYLFYLFEKGASSEQIDDVEYYICYLYYNFSLFNILLIKGLIDDSKILKKASLLEALKFLIFAILMILLIILMILLTIFILIKLNNLFWFIMWCLCYIVATIQLAPFISFVDDFIMGILVIYKQYYINIFLISFLFKVFVKPFCVAYIFMDYSNVLQFTNAYVMVLLVLILIIKIVNKAWLLNMLLSICSVLINLFFWYVGFFTILLYSFLVSILYGAIKVIFNYKIWAFFLIYVTISFDNALIYHIITHPILELINYFIIKMSLLFNWFITLLLIESPTIKLSEDEWISVNIMKWENMEHIRVFYKEYEYDYKEAFDSEYYKHQFLIIEALFKDFKERPYVWGAGILVWIGYYDQNVASFEEFIDMAMPTLQFLPKNCALYFYYYAYKEIFEFWNEFFFLNNRDKIYYNIFFVSKACAYRVYLHFWTFIFLDVPDFCELILKGDSLDSWENFINFIHYFIVNCLIFPVHFSLFFIKEVIYWLLEEFIGCGYLMLYSLKAIIGLITLFSRDLLYYFDLSFFLLNGVKDLNVFFFYKGQSAVYFKDLYISSYFRAPAYKFYTEVSDKYPIDIYFAKLTTHFNEIIALWQAEEDCFYPSFGGYNALFSLNHLEMHDIHNWLFFGLKHKDIFMAEFIYIMPFFYRQIIIYLFFCFILLNFLVYLLFVHILRDLERDSQYYLSASKPFIWAHVRDNGPKGGLKWVASFDFLSFFHVTNIVYERLNRKGQKEEQKPIKNKHKIKKDLMYIYCIFRLTKATIDLNTKLRVMPNGPLKLRDGLRSLNYHQNRLVKKLNKLKKSYINYKAYDSLKALRLPFDYIGLFHEKFYKDYILITEKMQWAFSKFCEYKKISVFHFLAGGTYFGGRLPIKGASASDIDPVNKILNKLFNYFFLLDKLCFDDKGPYIMLHKDPGNDILAYNEKDEMAYQMMNYPYIYSFCLDLLIWEIPMMLLATWFYLIYFSVPPPDDLELDDFTFILFWLLSFLEHFDIAHKFMSLMFMIYFDNLTLYHWDPIELYADDDALEGSFFNNYINFDELLSAFFSLPNYWVLPEAFHPKTSVEGIARVPYVFKSFLKFFIGKIFFLSIFNLASPLLLTYYFIKYFVILFLIFAYLIMKNVRFLTRKKVLAYVEVSTAILDYVNNFLRVKSKNLYLYCKNL